MEHVERGSRRRSQKAILFDPYSLLVFAIAVVFIACHPCHVGCLDTTKVEAFCNTESYQRGTQYERNLGKLVDMLVELTPKLNFTGCSRHPLWTDVDACYSCAACNGHISPTNCNSCLRAISDNYVKKACGGRVGMMVKLQDCRMRYENYKFDMKSF